MASFSDYGLGITSLISLNCVSRYLQDSPHSSTQVASPKNPNPKNIFFISVFELEISISLIRDLLSHLQIIKIFGTCKWTVNNLVMRDKWPVF